VRERVRRASVVSPPEVARYPNGLVRRAAACSKVHEWRDLFTGTAGPREISRGNARVHLPLRQRAHRGGGWGKGGDGEKKTEERDESKLVSANVARVTRAVRRLECFSIFPSRVLPASSLISLSNKSPDLYSDAFTCPSGSASARV